MANGDNTPAFSPRKCSAADCGREATRVRSGLCEKHYYRVRRRGKLTTLAEDTGQRPDLTHSHGYVLEHHPNHPIATQCQQSRVYQHRVRYYDAHGEGPFSCHWCGCQVTWSDMHVDHLNDVKSDNTITNLAATCAACNMGRAKGRVAATMRAKAKHVYEYQGERLTAGQWSARIGLTSNAIISRVARGWPIADALTLGRRQPRQQR